MAEKRPKRKYRIRLTLLPSILLFVAALFFWSQGTGSIDALRALCFLTALVAIRHLFLIARFPAFFSWFTAPYIGLFLVYPVVAPLTGVEIPATDAVLLDYLFLATGGLNLFIVGYEVASPRRAARQWNTTYPTTTGRLSTAVTILLALNLVAVLLLLANAGSLSTLQSQTRLDMKNNVGLLSMIGVYLLGLGALLYPLVAVQIRRKPSRCIFWAPLLIGLEVFLFLALRVRTFPVIHVVGFLVGWFLIAPRLHVVHAQKQRRFRARLSSAQKLTLIGVAVALVLGMFVHRTFRGQFQAADRIEEIEIDLAASVRYAFEGGGELGYSKWVLQILEIVPEKHDHLYGLSYYRLLFVPIPRAIWPDKPYNSQRIVAQWLKEGTVSVQTSPVGVIGDLYVNFGMWGILGMTVFGMFFGKADRSSSLTQALLLSVSFAMIFHLARGGFTNPLINLTVYYFAARVTARYLTQSIHEPTADESGTAATNELPEHVHANH